MRPCERDCRKGSSFSGPRSHTACFSVEATLVPIPDNSKGLLARAILIAKILVLPSFGHRQHDLEISAVNFIATWERTRFEQKKAAKGEAKTANVSE